MFDEREKRRDWHYITTHTADEAVRIKAKLRLQPGQTASIKEVGPDEFEIWITND